MTYRIKITDETPLVNMTAGQLAEYLNSQAQGAGAAGSAAPQGAAPRRFVYGLKGIMELFGVSNVTAQRYKRGIIRDAVSQYGRTIVTDAELALQLFREHKG